MFRCWHTDPEERLSFTDLVGLMSQTLANLGEYMEVCTFGALQEASEEANREAGVETNVKTLDGDDDNAGEKDGDNDAYEKHDIPTEKDKNDNAIIIDEHEF